MGYLTSASRDVKDAPVVPAAVLHGHTSAITCCDVSAELDVAITGAADGMVLVHSVREAQYIRELRCRSVSLRLWCWRGLQAAHAVSSRAHTR